MLKTWVKMRRGPGISGLQSARIAQVCYERSAVCQSLIVEKIWEMSNDDERLWWFQKNRGILPSACITNEIYVRKCFRSRALASYGRHRNRMTMLVQLHLQDQYKNLGEETEKLRVGQMKEQLRVFKSNLEIFARKHKVCAINTTSCCSKKN